MNPQFSIIIPIHNVATYLRECLESLLRQTFPGWEAICVDDGSTDGSGQIIDEYVRRDSRFKKVEKINGGVSSARNAALAMVEGQWVGFLDSDDKIEQDWLATVEATAKDSDADMIRLGLKLWFPDRTEGLRMRTVTVLKKQVIEGEGAILSWGWNNWLPAAWLCVCFMRKDVLLGSGVKFPEDARVMEDEIFDAMFLPSLKKIVQLPFDGYYYRQHEGSLWHKPRPAESSIFLFEEFSRIYSQQRNSFVRHGLIRVAQKRVLKIIWWELHSWLLSNSEVDSRIKRQVVCAASTLLAQVFHDAIPIGNGLVSKMLSQSVILLIANGRIHKVCAKLMLWRRYVTDRMASFRS